MIHESLITWLLLRSLRSTGPEKFIEKKERPLDSSNLLVPEEDRVSLANVH